MHLFFCESLPAEKEKWIEVSVKNFCLRICLALLIEKVVFSMLKSFFDQ